VTPSSFLQRLRATRLRPTVARIGVLQVIESAQPAGLDADAVFRRLLQRGTPASVGTVYRVIQQLQAHGLLLREWGARRKAVYRLKPAGFEQHAHRLVCRRCQHSVAFDEPQLHAALQALPALEGLRLAGPMTIQVECARGGGDAPCPRSAAAAKA